MKNEFKFMFPYSHKAILIETELEDVLKSLELYYGFMSCDSNTKYDEEIRIACERIDDIYYVKCGNKKSVVSSKNNLIANVTDIIRQKLSFCDGWCAYHGVALKYKGANIICLGESGAGKTTLAVYFSELPGAFVISEDIVLINYKENKVATVKRPMFVRQNSYDVLREEYNIKINAEYSELYDRYIYLPKHLSHGKEHKIDLITVIQRQSEGAKMVLIEDPVESLVSNSFLYNNIAHNIYSSFKIAENNQVYNLKYSSLKLAEKLLNNNYGG